MSTNINSAESVGTSETSYVNFVDLLANSILTHKHIQAYCAQCQKFHNSVIERRYVSTLPKIFAINTGLDNEMVGEPESSHHLDCCT